MQIFEPRPEFVRAAKMYDEAEGRYLAKFGEHSLDRVTLVDPLNSGQSDEDAQIAITDFLEGVKTLDQAIRDNKPIEQIPEEMWEKIAF